MLVKNTLAYTTSNVISKVILVMQRFVIRKILAPEAVGIWEYVLVAQGFTNTFDLGFSAAASIELPILHGAKNKGEEIKVRTVALRAKLIQDIFLALCVLFYAFIFRERDSQYITLALIVAAILVFLSSINDSLITFHQGRQDYISMSKINLYFSIFYAFSLCLGALLGNILGIFIAGMASFFLQTVLLYISSKRTNLVIHKKWDKGIFKRLLQFGLPLRIADYPLALFTMIDVLFVTKFLGVEALAIYTTAKVLLTQIIDIPAKIGHVFITRIYYLSGAKIDRNKIACDTKNFLLIEYFILLPLLICIGVYVFSFLVTQFLPQYKASITILNIIIFATYFHPQTTLIRSLWMLDKKMFSLGISNVVGLLGSLAMLYLTVKLNGLSLHSVALATLGGYFIYYLYLIFSIGREWWGIKGTLKVGFYSLVSCIASYLIINNLSPLVGDRNLVSAFKELILNLIYVCLLLSPFIFYGIWKTNLLKYIKLKPS